MSCSGRSSDRSPVVSPPSSSSLLPRSSTSTRTRYRHRRDPGHHGRGDQRKEQRNGGSAGPPAMKGTLNAKEIVDAWFWLANLPEIDEPSVLPIGIGRSGAAGIGRSVKD